MCFYTAGKGGMPYICNLAPLLAAGKSRSFSAEGEKMRQLVKIGLKCRLYAVLVLSTCRIRVERKTQGGRILAPFLGAPCVKRGREGEEAAHNVN